MIGGLGSAVADVLVRNCPVPMEIVGVKDKFGRSGKPAELLDLYELSAPHIVARVRDVLARKK